MIDVRLAGRYRLESEIGAGGMTGVWQAVDEVLERPVAVKFLHSHLLSNQVFCDRFRKEALAAGALIHPNIVSVYDTGQHDVAPSHRARWPPSEPMPARRWATRTVWASCTAT